MRFYAYIQSKATNWIGKLHGTMSEKKFLVIISIFVGMCAGLGAAILKDLINLLTRGVHAVVPVDNTDALYIILPVIGIALCGIFCRYIVKDNFEFGCDKIVDDLKAGNYKIKGHTMYSPILACTLTIGFGGSAGSEGPIAYTGAAIGSNVGRFFGLDSETLRTMVIIGGAAGIAGIFKAPVGGAMFALEVLAMPMTTASVTALMFACVASACVAYACSGFTIDISYMPTNFFDHSMTFGVMALGVCCAIYSVYYNFMMRHTVDIFRKIKNPWMQNLISGALIGGLIFLFPVLYGEGYGVVTNVVNGHINEVLRDTLYFGAQSPWVLICFSLGTILVKSIATAATNSGGGVGGDFAPTLFAGCIAGLLFAYSSNHILGTDFNVANFALIGMAGVMAGAIEAPLMAIFITLEMVGDFAMFFPLTICALISYGGVRLMHRKY